MIFEIGELIQHKTFFLKDGVVFRVICRPIPGGTYFVTVELYGATNLNFEWSSDSWTELEQNFEPANAMLVMALAVNNESI